MMDSALPNGWALITLDDALAAIVGGGTPPKGNSEYFQGSIPLMTVKDMKEPRPSSTGFNITEEALKNSSAKLVPADTVIIATRMGLGKVVRPMMATAINQDLKALFPNSALTKTYLEKWLISIASKIEAMGTGTTVKGVRLNQIRQLTMPLAPLDEQTRIVEKIETLFSQLDQGEAALRDVQIRLTRYRQSVLKAAVTGELTADWRDQNSSKLEHGHDLLARILHMRRENWIGRGAYKEPQNPCTSKLPKLPSGWVWITVDQILRADLSNGRSVRDATNGFPVLRLTALENGTICLAERKTGAWSAQDAEPFLVQRGDILVSRGNGSKQLVGRGGVVTSEPDTVAFPDTMIRIPIASEHISPEWFINIWNSYFVRMQIESSAKTTAGIYKINQTDIRNIKLPLPPLQEQTIACQQLATVMKRIDDMSSFIQAEYTRSSALRQSILKSAFSGKLVPQNSNDEPASELLARIRAERSTPPNVKPRKKVTV